MEYADVYDKDRRKLGRTVLKGDKLPPGEYYLAVHVWIMNSKGQFLIQKRASTVLYNPNKWSLTSGASITGEDTYGTCVREVNEELGIEPNMDCAKVIFTLDRGDNFCDVWLVHQEVDLNECILQVEEVSETRWVTKKEIFKMIAKKSLFHIHILKGFFEKIN